MTSKYRKLQPTGNIRTAAASVLTFQILTASCDASLFSLLRGVAAAAWCRVRPKHIKHARRALDRPARCPVVGRSTPSTPASRRFRRTLGLLSTTSAGAVALPRRVAASLERAHLPPPPPPHPSRPRLLLLLLPLPRDIMMRRCADGRQRRQWIILFARLARLALFFFLSTSRHLHFSAVLSTSAVSRPF